MTNIKTTATRRAFFLRGGAVLGAGVATTVGATALLPDASPAAADRLQQLQRQLTEHQDREAIRQLHRTFISAVENRDYESTLPLFAADATLQLSGLTATGKAAIARLFANQYRAGHAATLHSGYRQSPRQSQDLIAIAADGMQASATFHCDVEISSPLAGDSTLAQMARLQGQVAERGWQAGRFEARYVKHDGRWQMAALHHWAA